MFIGCHLSASRGYAAMVRTAQDIGANTFAFFTRNPRGSKAKPEDPKDEALARELLTEGTELAPQTQALAQALAHRDSYGLTHLLAGMDKLKRDALIPLLQQWLQRALEQFEATGTLPTEEDA